jgi:hypothetical protein
LFVDGFLGLATGASSEVNLGPIPTVYLLSGAGYIVGGVMFGIATFRAGILPRLAAGMLALAGPVSILAVALLPHALERFAAAPGGIALAWLGYALWSDRRAHISESSPVPAIVTSEQVGAA